MQNNYSLMKLYTHIPEVNTRTSAVLVLYFVPKQPFFTESFCNDPTFLTSSQWQIAFFKSSGVTFIRLKAVRFIRFKVFLVGMKENNSLSCFLVSLVFIKLTSSS